MNISSKIASGLAALALIGAPAVALTSGVGAGTAHADTAHVYSQGSWSRSTCENARDEAAAQKGFRAEQSGREARWESRRVLAISSHCEWENLKINGETQGTGYRFIAKVAA